jgi:vitamin K-dependent gamma-carboxylase
MTSFRQLFLQGIASAENLRKSLLLRLAAPVDGASLAFFRIAFGAVLLWEVWRYFTHGWIDFYWVEPQFHFSYWGFEWIKPWPGIGMDLHWAALGALAACIMLGLKYRIAAPLFFLGFAYSFLLDQAYYLNHFYLVTLISFLLIFIPAHRRFSLDAARKPELSTMPVPAWSVWLLRFQIGVPFFFGGIAKLNSDWLRGEPLRSWLAEFLGFPFLERWFASETVVLGMTYGAVIIDLVAVFLMLNRRTRVFGYLALIVFNLMNARLFVIGIFPWFLIAATLILFPQDWPRRVLRDIKNRHHFRFPALVIGAITGFALGALLPDGFSLMHPLIGAIGVAIAAYHLDEPFKRMEQWDALELPVTPVPRSSRSTILGQPVRIPLRSWALVLLGVWVVVQLVMPIRHLAIPGDVGWTEEGNYFAWHMILKDKTGYGEFTVSDPDTGSGWIVHPADFLNEIQQRKMNARPQMILDFAGYLEELLEAEGYQGWEVRGRFFASLNGRKHQALIKPEVDLSELSNPWMSHADWILPLEIPLSDRSLE